MSAYLLGLAGSRDDLALGVNRPRRGRAHDDAARRPSALAEAASSGTLDYLMNRRFVPNAAVGALSGAPSPVGATALSPTRSVDEFESPRRLIYDDDEDYGGAVTHGWRGFDRFRVQSRALDASAAPAAGINDGSSLGVALASRFGATTDGRSAYSAAPLDAQVRRVSKLAGILGLYGEDDPDSDDADDYDADDANAAAAAATSDKDADDRRQLGAYARRRRALLGDADDEPRGKLSLRAPIGDEYRASVDRALRRLGIDHLLPTWRERVRQWLAAAIFKPLAALMQREEQAPLVAAQQPAGAAAAVAKPSMFGTPFGKAATTTTTPAATTTSTFGTPATAKTGTSLFGSAASKTTTPTTPKTPPRRFGSTESLFSSPRPSASAAAATTATPGASSFSFGKPTTGSFGFGSATSSTATASKSLFPTSFPTTSSAASMFGASGARAVDEVKEPREQLKAYLRVLGCTTPEYVAQRLRELARGTCLGDYRWNGGGAWNGKQWTSDLPTDAQIVLHAFCTYMDALLPAQSSARAAAFSDNHVVAAPITGSKITSSIMLFQAHLHPPHIDVLFKKYLVPLQRGASNLFDALCVFLHCVERERDGFIGFVSLADRGVRLLDVVQ
jgi:hypothetical protein